MRIKITKNEWGSVYRKLTYIETQTPLDGQEWIRALTNFFDDTYREYLRTQGRGGTPPPLSPITTHLYSQMGDPDGSGIRNHIRVEYISQGDRYIGKFGILEGKPTMVAKVQDQGCVIPVTPKMRSFLARYGVYLKSTTTHITIPARYSWTNTIRDSRAHAANTAKTILRKIKNA